MLEHLIKAPSSWAQFKIISPLVLHIEHREYHLRFRNVRSAIHVTWRQQLCSGIFLILHYTMFSSMSHRA